jgi:hypothetical protein
MTGPADALLLHGMLQQMNGYQHGLQGSQLQLQLQLQWLQDQQNP